jgi:hypothetical protein
MKEVGLVAGRVILWKVQEVEMNSQPAIQAGCPGQAGGKPEGERSIITSLSFESVARSTKVWGHLI